MDEHDATEQAYKNGYEKGKQDAMRWIPVTEPPKEETVYQVFGYCKDWKCKKAWYGRWMYNQWFVNGICGGKISYNVTHWMPLPDAPKGE